MDSTTLEEAPIITLNASDRCDSCGAQAYAQAFFKEGSLLFCGHHFKKHREALEKVVIEIVDETFNIGDKRLDVSA